MRRIAAALACALSLVGALLTTPSQATSKLPVTYNFLVSAVAAGPEVDADPPGANDWSCRPTRRHPRPVILVHGTGGNKNTNWRTYAPLLKNNGYCVFALTYGVPPNAGPVADQVGGMNNIKESAKVFGSFVRKVRRATGARKVDLVGHSQGTLMPNYYVKFLRGARFVRNYVSLAPLWHGTASGDLTAGPASVFGYDEEQTPYCPACSQMAGGSKFIKHMRSGGTPKVKGVRYTNIVTKHDQLVVPYTSGIQKGMRNFVVQNFCATDYSEHFEIASDPVATVIVLNTLDRRRQQKIPCMVVLPFVGPAR